MFQASERLPIFRVSSSFISPSYPVNRNVILNLERLHSIKLLPLYLWTDSGYTVTGRHTQRFALVKICLADNLCLFDSLRICFVLFLHYYRKWIKAFEKLIYKCKVSKLCRIEYWNFQLALCEVDLQKMPSSSQISIQSVAVTDIKKYNLLLRQLHNVDLNFKNYFEFLA